VSKLRNFLILLIFNMWKKAALHVWFICVTIFSWLSSQPPRFLTSEEGRIAVWPTQRQSMSTFTNCCLVPITINSVFSSCYGLENPSSSKQVICTGEDQRATHRKVEDRRGEGFVRRFCGPQSRWLNSWCILPTPRRVRVRHILHVLSLFFKTKYI